MESQSGACRSRVRLASGAWRAVGAVLIAFGAVWPSSAPAQSRSQSRASADAPHVLTGRVRAADESQLVGAHVQLTAAGDGRAGQAATLTESDGLFRFEGVPDGPARLVVRRLGFRPETVTVDMPQLSGGPIVVLLERVAQPLAPILVRDGRRATRLASGFERRRANGFGHYITRADIDRRNPQRTTDLLRGMPGVTFSSTGGVTAPRFRSVGGRDACDPVYFVDGMPVGSATLDLDAINPKSIESVEVYSGAATVPAALRSSMAPGGCGAIALWSRHGDSAPELRDVETAVDSLDDMVTRGWAYTADQVELAAAPLPGFGPSPAYPDSLRAAKIGGRVVAEFIVDAQGRVDPETIGILSSTHPLFAAAVRESLGEARFSPAYRQNKVVRQVVHLPVVFEPPPTTGQPSTPH